MRIYTKTGDTGETSLFGGQRVAKDAIRVEAYGTVDELNAILGLARAKIANAELQSLLAELQAQLFDLGADLATPLEGKRPSKRAVPRITPDQVASLEGLIDKFEAELESLRSFILPGGAEGAAILHFARTVCRRAERRSVSLSKQEMINPEVLKYLNRLSDLLFVMARLVNKRLNQPERFWWMSILILVATWLSASTFSFIGCSEPGDKLKTEISDLSNQTLPNNDKAASDNNAVDAAADAVKPPQPVFKPPEAKPELLPGLPNDIAGYEKWLKLNAKPIPPRAGDPHNGNKNVYVNQLRQTIAPNNQQKFPYPVGSIVVKEAIRPGQDFLWLVSIMRKAKGNDPAHNDWTFIEYTRNGKDEAFKEIAKDAICWGCHAGAKDTDYVFTLLE